LILQNRSRKSDRLSRSSLGVNSNEIFNASVPGLLLFFSEVAGREFSVSTVISDALAALSFSWTARIGAIAILKISVDFTFQDQCLLLFMSSLIVSDEFSSNVSAYRAFRNSFLY